jgi:hypothetical protein
MVGTTRGGGRRACLFYSWVSKQLGQRLFHSLRSLVFIAFSNHSVCGALYHMHQPHVEFVSNHRLGNIFVENAQNS